MNLQRLASAVGRRASNLVARLRGVDAVTGMRIAATTDLVELGSRYGGWVVPAGRLGPDAVCYCAGCGEDISFDLALIDRFDCDVHGFDPTPKAIAHVQAVAGDNPKYHLHEIGLWDSRDTLRFYVPRNPDHVSHSLTNLQGTEDYITVPVERLDALMRQLGHSRLDLLKIDIEGAEYRVIDTLLEDGIDIGVLCVEYDEFFQPLDGDWKQRIRASVEKLQAAGFRMVHTAGNANYTFLRD